MSVRFHSNRSAFPGDPATFGMQLRGGKCWNSLAVHPEHLDREFRFSQRQRHIGTERSFHKSIAILASQILSECSAQSGNAIRSLSEQLTDG